MTQIDRLTCPDFVQHDTSPPLISRSVQSLETACEVLTAQYEACEILKLDSASLQKKDVPEQVKTEPLHYIYFRVGFNS